jgi:hypothetical protein
VQRKLQSHNFPHTMKQELKLLSCMRCGAFYFYEERPAKNNSYSKCCGEFIQYYSFPWKRQVFPELLHKLFTANHEHWKHFCKNIRHFNSSFAFGSVKATKWGDKKDKAEDKKYVGGAFVYRICGSIYRHVGATERLSDPDNRCFGQLYFIKVDAAL